MKKAFTLIEMLLTFLLIGIISAVSLTVTRNIAEKTTNSKMTRAVYKTLKIGVGNYIADNGMIKDLDVLCKNLTDNLNIQTYDCSQASSNSGSFNDKIPNFTLKNGAKFFNFGSKLTDYEGSYVDLDENIVYENSPSKNLENLKNIESKITNLDKNSPDYESEYADLKSKQKRLLDKLAQQAPHYIVYVDIDGKNRKGILNEDVITFIINMYGEVLPFGKAAQDVNYLSAGYKYLNPQNNIWTWVERNITFEQALCRSGVKTQMQKESYCTGISVNNAYCTSNQPCEYFINN